MLYEVITLPPPPPAGTPIKIIGLVLGRVGAGTQKKSRADPTHPTNPSPLHAFQCLDYIGVASAATGASGVSEISQSVAPRISLISGCSKLNSLSRVITSYSIHYTKLYDNVLDDYNREGLGIEVDLSLPAPRVIRALEQIIEWRGKPRNNFV